MPKKKDDIKYYLEDFNVKEISFVESPYVPSSKQAYIEVVKAKKGKSYKLVSLAKSDVEPSAGQEEKQYRVMFQKIDSKERKVYGYVYAPELADRDTDAMTQKELEKAAHSLLINLTDHADEGFQLNHGEEKDVAKFIESAIDRDGGIGKSLGFSEPTAGAWLVGVYVPDDDMWEKVETGKIVGFSIGGYANRVPAPEKKATIGGFFKSLRIGKQGDFNETMEYNDFRDEVMDAVWTLYDVISITLRSEALSNEEKTNNIRESFQQCYRHINGLLGSMPDGIGNEELIAAFSELKDATAGLPDTMESIKSVFEKYKFLEGENQMTTEEMKTAIGAALSEDKTLSDLKETVEANKTAIGSLTTDLAELKKADPPEGKKADPPEEPKMDEAVKALLEDVNTRLQAIEKTAGVRKSIEPDGQLPEGVRVDKNGVARTEDGKVDWATMMKGTNVDSRRLEIQ